MTKRVLLFSFVLVASVLCAAQTTRRLITDRDLFRFVWIADPQISPDGSEVTFVPRFGQQKAYGLRHRTMEGFHRCVERTDSSDQRTA